MPRGRPRLEGCDWESAQTAERRPIRVLYVDDDTDVAGCVAHQLERSGNVAVDTATSGPSGLAAVDETIDCVVCGYDGGELNGIEFLEALRERHPTLPFVLVADDGSETVAAKAAAAGVTEYVSEGFGSEQCQSLVERIERAVGSERNDRQIERLQRRLRKLIEHSTDVITVLGPDGTITFQSPSVERVLGFEPGEMIGESAFEFVHPEDRMTVVDAFDRGVGQPEELVELEWRARTAEGEWCWLHSVGTNRLDDPDVNGFVVNHRDVTDERRRERRLGAQRERMDRLVDVLSADLADPIASATDALERVADGAAGLDRPGEGEPRERARGAHERMTAGLEEAIGLTESGIPVEDPSAVAIPAIARSAWRSIDADGGVRTEDATLEVTKPGAVLADETRLGRLFDRLFRDALERRGSPEQWDGEGTLTIRVGTTPEGFFVAGVGEETPSVAGAGDLGGGVDRGQALPIVAGIATAHGWSLEAIEAPGDVTRFEVTDVERPGEW